MAAPTAASPSAPLAASGEVSLTTGTVAEVAGPEAAAALTGAPPPITPLGPIDPGPDQSPDVALTPVVLDPPVEPSPLTLPLRQGSELVAETETDALATLAAAEPGFLDPGGSPDLDPAKLQPQVASAQLLPTTPPTLEQVIQALLNLQIPPPLPIDVLALLQALPDGLPRITYRLCSESATKAVSCSITLPLGVPALVDVTGDGSVDVLADLLPAVSPDAVLAAVRELVDLQTLLAETQSRLTAVLALLQNPLALLTNPGLLFEALRLQQLVPVVQAELADAVEALVSLVNLGLGMLVLRLPTSETTGGPLPAHVWGVYDLPGHKRLSVGLDGFRRGTTLPDSTLGIFTFDAAAAIQDVFDVRGSLRQSGAGDAMAVTLGLASVAPDGQGEPFDPTVASAQFAPVPAAFDAHAVVDLGEEEGTIDAVSDRSSRLDAFVVSRRNGDGVPFGRFTQLAVDQVPTSLSASLTRPPGGGAAALEYRGSSPIAQLIFSDFEYAGARLDRALTAVAQDLPTSIDASLVSAQEPDTTDVAVDYAASSRVAGLDLGLYDRTAANLVANVSLRDIPTELSLTVDLPDDRVTFIGNDRLGSGEAVVSRDLGAFAPLDGDHATLVTSGAALGASARVTGLESLDAFFGPHPRATTEFAPGGQRFVAAGDVDGTHKARLDLSNLPSSASFDLDPAARTLAYRASSVVSEVKSAYTNAASGPTVVANMFDLPASIDAAWDLGERSQLTYTASSAIPRLEFFVSPAAIETLQPEAHHYLSVAVVGVPAEVDLTLDFPARHLEGVMSAPLESLSAVARFPFAGGTYAASAELTGVPARFDADFGDGAYRFRGLSGPLASATLSVTNHSGTNAPTGDHLAVRFREATGAFDASVSIRNLSEVEYSRGEGSQTFRLDADIGGAPVFIDTDVVLAAGGVDDIRLAAVGRVNGLPNTVRIGLEDGAPSYSSDRPIGIVAEVRLGKVAALSGLGAPLFDNGIAVRARGCAPGPGCASDSTPFCTVLSRCIGVVGTVNLPSLPTDVSLDLEQRTVSISGYQGPSTLRLYLALQGLPPLSGAALVTLTGLPSAVTFNLDEVSVGKGAVDIGYTASAGIGSLEVLAEGTDTPVGLVRGRAYLSEVPASFRVSGTYGSETNLTYTASVPIAELIVQASGTVAGGMASGLFELNDIPTSINLQAGGFGDDANGFNIPTLDYTANASTLDGLVQVEAALAREVGPVIAGVDNLYLVVADLGASTTITLTEAPAVNVSSTPATGSIQFGANIHVSAVPDTVVDQELASCCFGFFTARLQGRFGLEESSIDNVDVTITDVTTLSIVPGNTQGFVPAAVGFLFPGIAGNYERLTVTLDGVDLRPDVDLTFLIDRTIGPDVVNETLSLEPADFVRFHRYDQTHRPAADFQVEIGPADIVCLEVSATPGRAGFGDNSITVLGSDGDQMVAFLDSGDDVNDWILDLLTPFVSPFADARHSLSEVDPFSCD